MKMFVLGAVVLSFWFFGDSFYSIFFQGFGDHTFIRLNQP